jgi:hypothetical protein
LGRPKKLTPLEKMTIVIEYDSGKGKSSKILGEKYGVSPRTIRRVIADDKQT